MSATILLLEDDVALQDLLREVLQDEGYLVVAADSLPHLLAAAPAHADLLVTDLLVDFQMVGLQAIECIRQVVQPRLPALICTAAQQQLEILQPQVEQLKAHVLHKPFTIDELVDAVSRALSQSETQCPTTSHVSTPAPAPLVHSILRTSFA